MTTPEKTLRVAVVGCTHGELDLLYQRVVSANSTAADGRAIDLLICCGDFQAVRNQSDLNTMSCPDKYKSMQDFWRYYSGVRKVPVQTLFIGGNHEAASHCGELPLGGWVAPGIYYLGTSGCVNFGGLRIAGISGIFKSHNFWKGYFERPPYSQGDLKSINHQRAFDFWRCAHLAGSPVDVFLSHDWPAGVSGHGDQVSLLRKKPHFREDVERGELCSPPAMQLLYALQPRYWFAGHLHVKFSARVQHPSGSYTQFLALDKPIQGRQYFEILDIPLRPEEGDLPKTFHYDPLWWATVVASHRATPTGSFPVAKDSLPPPTPPSLSSTQQVTNKLAALSSPFFSPPLPSTLTGASLDPHFRPIPIPLNFFPSAPAHGQPGGGAENVRGNPQMDALLQALGLPHVTTTPYSKGTEGGSGFGPHTTTAVASAPSIQEYAAAVSSLLTSLPSIPEDKNALDID